MSNESNSTMKSVLAAIETTHSLYERERNSSLTLGKRCAEEFEGPSSRGIGHRRSEIVANQKLLCTKAYRFGLATMDVTVAPPQSLIHGRETSPTT
jgi:hypothetical protein